MKRRLFVLQIEGEIVFVIRVEEDANGDVQSSKVLRQPEAIVPNERVIMEWLASVC